MWYKNASMTGYEYKAGRLLLQLTQDELARKLHVHVNTIQRIERHKEQEIPKRDEMAMQQLLRQEGP